MKLLLLASGTGSLAQAVIDAGFDIAAVVSDVPGAQVLDKAVAANIATKVIEFKKPREVWDSELIGYVESVNPDLVVSVGFMRILSAEFVSKFKVINSHPALLPNFPGAHAVRDALAAKVSQTGCTVHWVDAGVDTGQLIAQVAVDVLSTDDESSLHERIKIVERELIVNTIKSLESQIERS
jgi:phosphoribosylglycinamide formyltransferase-1